ncbi:hypothetical protein FE257_008930 [Aspergillus nanangensis]|uniref:Uncharacterized protein n=1 Tax=Aspergillus nanangensis TaxID=2582783 RepID=A0AAD4CWE6_ASPNN|nr:hypothetical protein FE257_008930 [Aspergillus nanangensis]
MADTQTPPNPQIAIWRQILLDPKKSWVLFEHGTCVILMQPAEDLATQAKEIMAESGAVHPGSSAGDFNVLNLDDDPVGGWVVLGHHPDILNYVPPPDEDEEEPATLMVGLLGRGHRGSDAEELTVVHVEDNRS